MVQILIFLQCLHPDYDSISLHLNLRLLGLDMYVFVLIC